MTTGLEIITKALQKNGVLTKSEVPAADEADDALDTLNAMISAWSTDGMMIYARTADNFTLVPGTAEYTIGSGQTFNTTRPMFIVEAHVRQGSTDYPMSQLTDESYAGISDKSGRSTPKFYNYTNGFPVGTIKLYPTPDAAYTLYMLSEKELTGFTLAGTVSLPPGWELALIYNLALLLGPEYGQEASALTVKIAAESKAGVMRTIMRNRSMDYNPPVTNRRNIYTGWFN